MRISKLQKPIALSNSPDSLNVTSVLQSLAIYAAKQWEFVLVIPDTFIILFLKVKSIMSYQFTPRLLDLRKLLISAADVWQNFVKYFYHIPLIPH